MLVWLKTALFLLILFLRFNSSTLGVYFANWAHYRQAPYTFTPTDLVPIINKIDNIFYFCYYFCPPPGTSPMPYWAIPPYGNCTSETAYQLLSVEPMDFQYIPQLVGFKSLNPKLKVFLSIGGWNFPSHFFSQMAMSKQSRSIFIQSVISTLNQFNLDGVEIDWEYPCSDPRTNNVKISCWLFRPVTDNGGSCPLDTQNIVLLASELKTALGSKQLSIASQAARKNEIKMNIRGLTPFVDVWHVMTYDYSVSALPYPSVTSPNSPIYMPSPPATQMCINKTIYDYLSFGVPRRKIRMGIPLYGHTWYTPNNQNWMNFGVTGSLQGQCCGPYQSTYGAKPGKGSILCGLMMYSEIQNAAPTVETFDEKTQTDIGYWTKPGSDDYTAAGTWVTFNGIRSVKSLVQYCKSMGLDGVFVFDSSNDGMNNGIYSFPLINQIRESLNQ